MAKGDWIDTDANKQAGEALLHLRGFLGFKRRNRTRPLSQAAMARLLAEQLGTPAPSQTTLSDWEGAESTVPAAMLIAAAKILEKQIGRALTIQELLDSTNLRAFFTRAA